MPKAAPNTDTPAILTSYPAFNVAEAKGARTKRHISEKKDLELLIRQRKVENRVANKWLARLKELQDADAPKAETQDLSQMLADVRQNNQSLAEKAKRSEKALRRDAELQRKMDEYMKSEFVDRKEWEVRKLSEVLAQDQLEMSWTPADGNCLYTSVERALQLPGGSLRRRLADYIAGSAQAREQVKNVHEDLDVYLAGLRGTEWGDELEIALLADLLNVQVRVYNAFMTPLVYGTNTEKQISIVFCNFQIPGASHYNGTKPLAQK